MLAVIDTAAVDPAGRDRAIRGRTPPWVLPAVVGAVAGGLVFALAHRTLIDDAYITLAYARTLAEHGVWGMAPQLPANTATSPLTVVLLAAPILVTGRPVLAAGLLLVAALAVAGGALGAVCARLGRAAWPAALGAALLAVNPLLVSVIGMETHLVLALVALLGWAVLAGRPVVAGALCGLLLLTRADLIGFCLAAVVAIACTRGLRAALAATAVAAGIALPWPVATWFWLGSAVPDTMVVKIGEGMDGRTFTTGLWYFWLGYPYAVTLSLIPAAIGLAALVTTRRGPYGLPALVWGAGGLLHAGTYVLLGTAPYQWYYGPALGALTMLGAVGVARPALRVVVAGACAAVLAVTAVFLGTRSWTLTTVTGNWATASEYEQLAAHVPEGAVVSSFGEVGTLAYFCRCTVSDRLTDRGWFAAVLAGQLAAAGPVTRTLLELNYRNFRPPPQRTPQYEFRFADDPSGVPATSWRGDQGEMVVVPVGSPGP